MAVNEVLNQLQGLIRGAAPQLIEGAGQLAKDAAPFVPGERFSAKVLEQVANGRFLVQIRDQILNLNLPRNTQAGQNIELRFVSAAPRLTFVLAEGPPLAPGQAKAPVSLSDGARYLNALLDRVQNLATQQGQAAVKTPGQAQAALGLQLAKPVLEGAPPAPGVFAALLKDTVAKSGLFYESHQAQWVKGEKPLVDILREPQGRLSEARAFTQATAAGADPAQVAKAHAAQLLAVSPSPVADGREPVHPQSAPLVQQQLEVLDTRQLIWQGQVWPGQELHWQIEERAPHEGEADAAREWQTQLNLHLPNLGEVNALLKISAQGGIRIALTAHSPEVAQTLRAASARLNQNLETAGLQLIQLEVASDG